MSRTRSAGREPTSRESDPQLGQLLRHRLGPARVRRWARRARMQDPADRDAEAFQALLRALLGEVAHADHVLRLQALDYGAQASIADLVELGALGRSELVGRAIPAGLLHEDQRAVVRDEHALRERFERTERVPDPSPQPRAADLAALASEAFDRSLGMLPLRLG